MSSDNVHYLFKPDGTTTSRIEPDLILEAAKGNDFHDVLVMGIENDGSLWLSGSTSDAERITFLLVRAMHKFMRLVDDEQLR